MQTIPGPGDAKEAYTHAGQSQLAHTGGAGTVCKDEGGPSRTGTVFARAMNGATDSLARLEILTIALMRGQRFHGPAIGRRGASGG